MSAFGVRIAGVGHYVPERVLSNHDLEKLLDTSDEWITTRTGMKERRVAAPEQTTSDLALIATNRALESAGVTAKDVDCIILGTVTPDYPFPATACMLGSKLGVVGTPAFDIEIACSGFVYGLSVGSSMIRAGVFKRILLVGAEKLSAILNYQDRTTAILFGDGAGAAILERAEEDSYLGGELGADGTTPEILYVPGGGTTKALSPDGLAAFEDKVSMRGKEIFKYAVNKMAESAAHVLAQANLRADDVDVLVPHQANRRIIDAAAKLLGIPSERVIINIEKYGNTSAASVPIALSEAVADGRIKPGNRIMFSAFGGGLSWGSIAWKWTGTNGSVGR